MRLTRVRGVSSLRLVIRVDQGPGCRLHPLQRLCQTHRPYREVVVMLV
jgi:hypothetical protein